MAKPKRGSSPPEPKREHRPSVEELGGTSEYQVRAASGGAPGGPSDEDTRQPEEEPLSQRPDELGASFLRRAVQDPRVTEDDEELPRSEAEAMDPGEQRMLDDRLGPVEAEGSLVTSRPARAEVERELSEKTRRAGREVRTPRRGARIREQSARVAELRGGATPRARKKPERQ